MKVLENLPFINSGTARSVHSVDQHWVVKAPINRIGSLQNKAEAEIYTAFHQTEFGIMLPKCYLEEKDALLYMEKVIPLPDLKTETIQQYITKNHPHIQHPDADLIRRFVSAARLHPDDIYTSDAWGILGNRTVIFDFGCTVDIFSTYYAW